MAAPLLLLFGPLLLGGCASLGLAASEALVAGAVVGTSAAVVANEGAKEGTKVYGTYRDGFWFDRDRFSVWVVADSPDEAERVARSTATDSCRQQGKDVTPIYSNAWQERALFIPMKLDRFSFEMQFRCGSEGTKAQ